MNARDERSRTSIHILVRGNNSAGPCREEEEQNNSALSSDAGCVCAHNMCASLSVAFLSDGLSSGLIRLCSLCCRRTTRTRPQEKTSQRCTNVNFTAPRAHVQCTSLLWRHSLCRSQTCLRAGRTFVLSTCPWEKPISSTGCGSQDQFINIQTSFFTSSIYSTGRENEVTLPRFCSLWDTSSTSRTDCRRGRMSGKQFRVPDERETGHKGSLTGTVFALYCKSGQEESCKSSLLFPVCKSPLGWSSHQGFT